MALRKVAKVEPMQRVWLEKKEARQYLGGCSDDFLEKLMKEEKLTVAIVGRKVFYEVASIENLMQKSIVMRQRI